MPRPCSIQYYDQASSEQFKMFHRFKDLMQKNYSSSLLAKKPAVAKIMCSKDSLVAAFQFKILTIGGAAAWFRNKRSWRHSAAYLRPRKKITRGSKTRKTMLVREYFNNFLYYKAFFKPQNYRCQVDIRHYLKV